MAESAQLDYAQQLAAYTFNQWSLARTEATQLEKEREATKLSTVASSARSSTPSTETSANHAGAGRAVTPTAAHRASPIRAVDFAAQRSNPGPTIHTAQESNGLRRM